MTMAHIYLLFLPLDFRYSVGDPKRLLLCFYRSELDVELLPRREIPG